MAVWSSIKTSALSADFRIDADYYRPEVLAMRRAMKDSPFPVKTVEDLSDSVVNFGAYSLCSSIEFQETNERDSDAVQFITAQDIQDGFLEFKNARWIPARQHTGLLWKSKVSHEQVLVAMAARLGHAAVFDGAFPLNSSQDIAKITIADTDALDPYYLSAYINSTIGRGCLLAEQTGSVQQHTNLGRIKGLGVVVAPIDFQNKVSRTYKAAIKARLHANEIMLEAEHVMLDAVGLTDVDLTSTLHYSRQFTDLIAAGRFGAEYFMPAKMRVHKALAAMPHRLISEHFDLVKDLFQPERAPKGAKVRNYDLADATDPFLDATKETMEAEDVGSTKKRFIAGDVVVGRLRSYLKQIAVVRDSGNVPCVGSSEFIVLRPTPNGLPVETLLVFLRSTPIQAILTWSQDGSNHPRFSDKDLVAIPIPDRVTKIAPKVNSLVDKSIASRQDAYRLIDDAKCMVDEMILGKGK